MGLKQRLPGLGDAGAHLRILQVVLRDQVILPDVDGPSQQTPARVRRPCHSVHRPYAYEPARASLGEFNPDAQTPVGEHDKVPPAAIPHALLQRLLEMRVRVYVLHRLVELRLVEAAVQDRYLVAPLEKPVDDEGPRRSRPSDNQCSRHILTSCLSLALRKMYICLYEHRLARDPALPRAIPSRTPPAPQCGP